MRQITINANDYKNATDCYLTGTALLELDHILFARLVPATGLAKTTAGSKVQRINRSIYRYLNDGDKTPKMRADHVADMTESQQIMYFWKSLLKVLVEVCRTRAGAQALKDAGVEVVWNV